MTAPGMQEAVLLDVGAAGRAMAAAGEGDESGDLHVVLPFERGVLVAVIDGLGHGSAAAAASRAAAEVLARQPDAAVLDLIERCHQELRRTRGAVMSLVRFSADDSSASWAGVGNVDGVLLPGGDPGGRQRDAIGTRAGVVGCRLPPLREQRIPVWPGDTLVMATDGVRSRFASDLPLERSPQELAEWILARNDKGTDDALVLVARYIGCAP